MCAFCGNPGDKHDDNVHSLTVEDLKKQAEAAGLSLKDVVDNLTQDQVRLAAEAAGVSNVEARTHLAEALKNEEGFKKDEGEKPLAAEAGTPEAAKEPAHKVAAQAKDAHKEPTDAGH